MCNNQIINISIVGVFNVPMYLEIYSYDILLIIILKYSNINYENIHYIYFLYVSTH